MHQSTQRIQQIHGNSGASVIIHAKITSNNTMITVTDPVGNALFWVSGGRCGQKGTRKSTAYAAQLAIERVIIFLVKFAKDNNNGKPVTVDLKFSGIGSVGQSATTIARTIATLGSDSLIVLSVGNMQNIPHNGPRPPKRRRI